MAWTTTKQNVLKELLNERIAVEQNPEMLEQWDLSTTWIGILNNHVTNAIKQLILNDLIDDKVHYLGLEQDKASASITALQVTIDQGTALKE